MLNTEAGPTRTCRGGSRGSPPFFQGKGINKSTLMKAEAMFLDGREVSQLEEPCSRAKFVALWRVGVRLSLNNIRKSNIQHAIVGLAQARPNYTFDRNIAC